ncbi:hypothetical protein GQ600_19636 [Phytophthora cactorum]|nr:hypothetical protein GQ600_19636 [Phytophthora cactorum]
MRIPSDQGSIFGPEFWFQVDNRETPMHVDHGRAVSYIPPSARHCFKMYWVSIQAMLSTSTTWCSVLCCWDIIRNPQRLTRSRRGSNDAWVALLSAYCVMEGREWHDANYKEEKRMFLEKLQAAEETIRASKAAADLRASKAIQVFYKC